jgi:hypothetical protein
MSKGENNSISYKGSLLTNKRDTPFILCFKYPLEKRYNFSNLQMKDVKAFQKFLDKISQMTVQQVDVSFSKAPDKEDTFNGLQVYHYAVTDTFRIHVVNEAGIYKILRLDPNHAVHR